MENSNLDFNINQQTNEQLKFVMHEIHSSLTSIDKKLDFLSRRDLSKREEQETVKKGILDACSYTKTIRGFLDYLQLSSSPDDYFDGAEMRSVDLWSVFKNPNEYFKSIMKKRGFLIKSKK